MSFSRWLGHMRHIKEGIWYMRIDGVKLVTDVPCIDEPMHMISAEGLREDGDLALGYQLRRLPKSRVEFQLFGPWYGYIATLLKFVCSCDGTIELTEVVDGASLCMKETGLESVTSLVETLFSNLERQGFSYPDVYHGCAG